MLENQIPANIEDPKSQKIGGWLILVGIGMIVNPLRLLYRISKDLIPIFFSKTWTMLTTPGTRVYHPLWAPLIIFELLTNIVFLIFSIVLAVFFFQKRRALPRMIIVFLLLNLAFIVIDYLLAQSILGVTSQGNQDAIIEIVRSVIVCLIWVPYFLTSKRVKGTFIH